MQPHALALDVARRLRGEGAGGGAATAAAAVAALRETGTIRPPDLYWALRLTLVRRHEDLPAFDAAFAEVVAGAPPAREPPTGGPAAPTGAPRPGAAPPVAAAVRDASAEPGADDSAADDGPAAASAIEVLRRKDFELYDEDDFARLSEQLASRGPIGPFRRGRRLRRARRGRLDMRATVRAALHTGGLPLRRCRSAPAPVPRPLVFLCDISGSMERHARAMLQLAHVVALRRRRVEAFAFATRLTRLTPLLAHRDPVAALDRARDALVDWSGGTRIGAALDQLHRRHADRVRGGVVVIASDGWDRGDIDQLAAEAAWLHRVAHCVVWVNPHLRDPAFEPLTRGLTAALPHIDRFVPGHDIASLTALLDMLDTLA